MLVVDDEYLLIPWVERHDKRLDPGQRLAKGSEVLVSENRYRLNVLFPVE